MIAIKGSAHKLARAFYHISRDGSDGSALDVNRAFGCPEPGMPR